MTKNDWRDLIFAVSMACTCGDWGKHSTKDSCPACTVLHLLRGDAKLVVLANNNKKPSPKKRVRE